MNARYRFGFVYRRLTQRVKRRCSGPFCFSDSDAVGPSASATATLWALLLQRQRRCRVKRRCGPFCFSDGRQIRIGTWPLISRDATLSSAYNHREKAESSYQPASMYVGSESQLRVAVIYNYTLKNLPKTADNSRIIPSSRSSLLFSKLFQHYRRIPTQ